jgi:hypothetical protein
MLEIPIIATTLGVAPEIAGKIRAGLDARIYERVGGVIRRVDNKQVVTWLRDVSEGLPIDATVLSKLGPLLHLGAVTLNAVTSTLNLGITAIGFVMVMKQLESIQDQLKTISMTLADIKSKLDLNFYANFQTGIQLAKAAIAVRDGENSQKHASDAINYLTAAEQQYLPMLDRELKVGSQAVSPFLSLLFLAYASVARCYLIENETKYAWQHLQEGEAQLSSRVKQHYSSIIEVNPAIFLHPTLADSISLERLTYLLRHNDPSLTESSAFESLRKAVWETASQNPEDWLRRLPASLWNQDVDGWEKKDPVHLPSRLDKMVKPVREHLPAGIDKWISPGPGLRPRSGDEMLKQVLQRLPEAFMQVELAQESLGCIEGYGIELKYLLDNNIEYAAWQQLKPPAAGPDDPVAILLPKNSELMAN